jgi:tetratricopeptide (TPR) repeat protein
MSDKSRERQYLENASSLFERAPEKSGKRIRDRVDTEFRLSRMLRDAREFIRAEEKLVSAATIYEDAIARRIFLPRPQFGAIYAGLGDLEYFTKYSPDGASGDFTEALHDYKHAEDSGYSTKDMQYRMGAADYNLGDFDNAEKHFFRVSTFELPNRRILNSLGNTSYLGGRLFAAQGYFSRLLSMLESDKLRITDFNISDERLHRELAGRIMIAQNNLGATYSALSQQTGNPSYRNEALAYFGEAARYYDNLTRDPETLVRPGILDFAQPNIGLPYTNLRAALYPEGNDRGKIYSRIDRDAEDWSEWEELLRLTVSAR